MSQKPRALVLSGHGLNCERETAFAFEQAGAEVQIHHLNDLAQQAEALDAAQILAVPGGFSFGDHLGAGKAFASALNARLDDAISALVERGGLVIGICNGAQILLKTRLFAGAGVTLAPNAGGAYLCQWEGLSVTAPSPWLDGLDGFDCPIAHGEGRYAFADGALERLKAAGGDALRYSAGRGAPNGAEDNLAGITVCDGRVLAMMPHPERALLSHHHPDYHRQAVLARRDGRALPDFGPTLTLFQNAVKAAAA